MKNLIKTIAEKEYFIDNEGWQKLDTVDKSIITAAIISNAIATPFVIFGFGAIAYTILAAFIKEILGFLGVLFHLY